MTFIGTPKNESEQLKVWHSSLEKQWETLIPIQKNINNVILRLKKKKTKKKKKKEGHTRLHAAFYESMDRKAC
jgi:hypothetical protein